MNVRTGVVRTALLVTASAVAAGGLVVAEQPAATAATVREMPSPTYQTNGRVDVILRVGTTTYLGGDFTAVRPAGSAPDSDMVARARLAAFSTVTGDLLPWNPGVNRTVNALAASPDGGTIYVGGRFGRLGGQPRHNLGAVRAVSGHVKKFRADTDRRVLALAATKRRLYVGGKLTRIDGRSRHYVAAVSARGRVLRTWRPGPNGFVRALALTTNRKSVFVGGDFTRVGGKKQRRLARLSAKTGLPRTFHRHPRYPVVQIVATRHRLYVAGNGAGGHAASYTVTGGFRWMKQFDGAVHSVALMDGTLYVGGQYDNICVGNTGHPATRFNCPTVLTPRRHLAALESGDGSPLSWNPGANSVDGVLAVAAGRGSVQIGGDFTKVDGVHQQGFAAFPAT